MRRAAQAAAGFGGHQWHRLDVHRLARARRIVDDAQAHRFGARLDRQDVALLAHGDVLVLEHRRELVRAHERLDGRARAVRQLRALAPQAGQHGRHGVADLARGVEGLAQQTRQHRLRVHGGGAPVQLRRGRAPARRPLVHEPAHRLGHGQQVGDGAHLFGPQHQPLFGRGQDVPQLRDVERRQRLAPPQDGRQLVDGRHVCPRPVGVVLQGQLQARGAPRFRLRAGSPTPEARASRGRRASGAARSMGGEPYPTRTRPRATCGGASALGQGVGALDP